RPRRAQATSSSSISARASPRVDLIEDPAVGKMLFLHLGPAAEVRERHELQLRILFGVLGGDRRIARPVVVARNDLLTFRAVEIFKIRLRDFSRASAQYDLVDDRD